MRSVPRLGMMLSVIAVSGTVAACGGGSGGGGGGAAAREGVTKDTIKYGMIYDQTGAQNVAQLPWSHGVLTQIKKANDAGGINGRKIEVIQADDKSEVPTGIAAYKRMVSQTPVVGISGLNLSQLQEAAMPQIRKDKMPLVGPQSTTKAGFVPFNDTAFYVIPSYADQVDVMLGYMKKRISNDNPKIAIFRLVAASGLEVDELIKERVEAGGNGEIVADEELDPTATTADAQIQKIVAAKPDYVVFHTSPTLSTLALKAMQKLDAQVPVISTFAGGGPVPYQAVDQKTGDQFQYTSAFTPADIEVPGTAEMVEDAKKYGYAEDATNSQYVIGYLSGKVVVEGLKNAGKDLDRASFVDGLEKITDMDTGGLSENIGFGPDDRAGLSGTRPFKYNYSTKKFEAVGEFTDYDPLVQGQYLKEAGGQ